ncbi:hypothetical protein [Turneriella parva]|uniref:Uncharacterized protein n=1 Tax=Turneriella parva (strain ATCC BAA-1111 / DSM 21527 / NCTC 11395 / H) TaxID=869212 RepID=I4BA34_TURPD|nr:hypothetical protein [Turneriella parva]AFM14141.1 hypothetical protein Turpa_3504 [Turneriella parva DSM 21527]
MPETARNQIIQVLTEWTEAKLTENDVWRWASARCLPGEDSYEGWLAGDRISHEVMLHLNSLDMYLVVRDDIPIYLQFLKRDDSDFESAYRDWQESLREANTQERRRQLKKNPIYAPFC